MKQFDLQQHSELFAFSSDLGQLLESRGAGDYAAALRSANESFWNTVQHGDLPRWLEALESLPTVPSAKVHWNQDVVSVSTVNAPTGISPQVESALRPLMPWRKGPFQLFGVAIDTEWRSDWKWRRLADAIAPLDQRLVLDVGSGNGYYMWRMLGAGAAGVLGIEPTLLYSLQFAAVLRYLRNIVSPLATSILPLPFESAPQGRGLFDSAFSMGVLYHRKNPLEHLQQLHDHLRPGGQLVLESIVIEGDEDTCLLPRVRYANMRNVWFLPSVGMLERMLSRSLFQRVETIDVSTTTCEEQRPTAWMTYESLSAGLNPDDVSRTKEGYPAPRRAIVLAERAS